MDRTIVLDVNDGDNSFEDTVVAVVEMTPELAKLILDRAKTVKQWKERDSQLTRAVFYSNVPSYFAYDQELTVEQQEALVDEVPVILAKSPFDEKDAERTEYNQMHVDDEDVWWRTSAKHSGTFAETRPIRLNDLEKFLAEG